LIHTFNTSVLFEVQISFSARGIIGIHLVRFQIIFAEESYNVKSTFLNVYTDGFFAIRV